MYTTIEQFIKDYRNESASTQKLMNLLTDASLKQEFDAGHRTLGFLAWHIVPFGGLLNSAGLEFPSPEEGSEPPASAAVIAETYAAASAALIEAVRKQWTDEMLPKSFQMFGQEWTYGQTLEVFIRHEVHHRGQMTVLMRQAGLPLAGMYGPSREEYSAFGMEAPR